MFEEEIHLRDYLRVLVKWRWLIIAVLIPIVLFVTLTSYRTVPIYKATARILIERAAPQVVSFADPNASNSSYWWDPQFLETQLNIIQSHTVAEKVTQKLEKLGMLQQIAVQPNQEQSERESLLPEWLEQKISSIREFLSQIPKLLGEQEPPVLSDVAKTAVEEDQIIKRFLGMITVMPLKQSRLVDIGVTSKDPEQAAFIANAVVDTYIEHNLEARAAASRDAVRWLVEEVENARQKVADSEAALQEYKEQYKIISVEGRQNIVMQKLSDLSAAVNAARIKRIALEAQYRGIQQYQAAELESLSQVINSPIVQELRIELSNLERELSELQKTFRDKHPKVTAVQSQIEVVQNKLDAEIARIPDSIKREYEMALVQEQDLTKALEEQKSEALDLNQKAITYGILEKEVESNRKIHNALLQRMKETSVTERLETTNIQIVDRATIPTFPINLNRPRNILLAMIVGLVMGTSLAFFLEYWNDKIATPEDLKRHLDIPFLGIIPKASVDHILSHDEKAAKETVIATIVLADPKSAASEAYRGLRTHVTFSELDDESLSSKRGSTLLVTSAEPSEGKSCTVANLGIAMAQSGQKTLIIDCDFRKPMIDKIFYLKEVKYGFSNILMDTAIDNGVGNVVQRTDIENLHVIPCGKVPPNPSELLSLRKTADIIRKLGDQYERILIDSPPVNVVADAMILSQFVDGVILICRAGKTKRHVVQRAKDQLLDVGATILGGVLNSVDVRKGKYYSNYYYYAYHYPKYYRQEKKEEPEDKKSERLVH